MGKYPDVSLQEVRKRHWEAREQLAQGIDPSEVKKVQKAAGVERTANSFEVIAREWFARWKDGKAVGTVSRALSALEKDVIPYGTRPNGRVYNRTVHLTERKRMMSRWADYLDGLRIQADVVVEKGG